MKPDSQPSKQYDCKVAVCLLQWSKGSIRPCCSHCNRNSENISSSKLSDKVAMTLVTACDTCWSVALFTCSVTCVALDFSAPICSWCRVRFTSTETTSTTSMFLLLVAVDFDLVFCFFHPIDSGFRISHPVFRVTFVTSEVLQVPAKAHLFIVSGPPGLFRCLVALANHKLLRFPTNSLLGSASFLIRHIVLELLEDFLVLRWVVGL